MFFLQLARHPLRRRDGLLNWSALTTALLIIASCPGTAACQERPNLILIMADDMGYGDSSVYGGWVKTPQLERMAAEGLKFTDFHSSGVVCSPTRAGLLTGRYQQRAGIPGVINADPDVAAHYLGLQPREATFAERLGASGYATAIFGKWHLGYDQARYSPLQHGFDTFRGFVSGNIDYISHHDRMQTYDWWEGREQVREEGYLTHLVTRHAVRFIQQHKDQPFCLYVPHGAVHSPLQAPGDPAGRGPQRVGTPVGRPQRETVRLMLQALDDGVGAILDAVREAGLADNTFVFFLSDNGGARHCKNDPLRGGKGSVWEGGHRVPAIAWWPGKIKAGSVTAELSISLDLMPTMLALAGVKPPPERSLDGVSLVPLLLRGESLGARQLFWNGVAMRAGNWKLVSQDRRAGRPLLFDLEHDLAEQMDVAAEHPERVRQMMAALAQWKLDVARDMTPQPGKAGSE